MSNGINRRCPQCGRKAHDRLLVLCPDCRVPFVDEAAPPPPAELTPEQLDLVTRLILRSWKFWAVLVILAGMAVWTVIAVANHVIEARSREYLNQFGQQATNQLGAAFGQISNQIAAELRSPKIKTVIEQTARDKAGEMFDNSVHPSVEAFQSAMDMVNAELTRASNAVVQLEINATAAERRIPPPQAPVSNPAPVVSTPAPVTAAPRAPVAANPAPAPASSLVRLVLASRAVSPAGSNYMLTLIFRLADGSPSGVVDMMAGTYKQSARILSFASMTAGASSPPVMSDTGDVAELKFTVSDRQPPALVLELSAPTIVRLASDSLDTDLTVPVAADKMALPTASK